MFSIVIPLYNKANHIEDAIRSLMRQSFDRFEIIVVDNNSSDDGLAIVEKMDEPRIVVVEEKNQGVSYARNRGVSLAKYHWICFLDADDTWEKDQLLNFNHAISKHTEILVFANNYKIVDAKGRERKCERNNSHYDHQIYNKPCFFHDYNHGDMPVNMNSVCMHKDVFQKIGGFSNELKNGEDTLFWMKIFLRNKIYFTDYVGSTYHLKASNRSNNLEVFSVELPVIKEFVKVFKSEPIFNNYQKDFHAFIAKHLFVSVMANIKLGRLALAKSFFYDKRVYAYPQKTTLFVALLLSFTPIFISKSLLKFLHKKGFVS